MSQESRDLDALESRALAELDRVKSPAELEEFKNRFLGKKGEISLLMRRLGDLPQAERPLFGEKVNKLKERILAQFTPRLEEFNRTATARAAHDFTLPGRHPGYGSIHPLVSTLRGINQFFTGLGYFVAEGPEAERDYYNFEALNFPADHPARDMQDTFFLGRDLLLRTHTSGVQIRTMETFAPPIKMIAPGRVFRRDHDITHSPVFHQVEGLAIGRNISFADLKGTLYLFLRWQFGEAIKVRFRPSFFPFTEPSAEVDISCIFCQMKGCRVCSHTGWLEILGCGMVHPNVLNFGQVNPEEYAGFAFGMGVERIAMLRHGISDIRLFYENDVRFLRQFPGGL